jgi:methyltransferase
MPLKLTHDWDNHWRPQEYLSQYYQTPKVPSDETVICQFIISHLGRWSNGFSTALDIGVGPTLHHEIALAPYVKRLDVADYLPQNLAEIRKWLNGERDAHDWDIYIRGILNMEGTSTANGTAVESRKRLVKQSVNRLLPCNIKNTLPLGTHVTYPLVTAFYLADSVASSKADWSTYMANIVNLVEPGGTLLISALRNAEYYRVGDALFPSAKINEEDVERLYLSLNFVPSSLDIQVDIVSEWKDEGFDSIIVASGKKKAS